ncbi:MAG TPA: sterol desaturase family protein [Cyclobacteriaceae bacterium]|nr:sterol desaturase family protein [Cyclobacteriaceae bacterium]
MTTQTQLKLKGSGKIFDKPWLERMTKTHIAVPVTIFFLYAGALLWWSIANTAIPGWQTAALFFLGLFVFTWVEYNVHRYLFHIPTTTPARKRFQYIMHGVHHEYPKDKDRIAMPPILSISISTGLLLVLRLILGDYSFSSLAGFLVGYAAYLSVHYIIHVYSPPRSFLKALWKNHVKHHYKDGDIAFGVTSPFWDYVYGTNEHKWDSKEIIVRQKGES